MRSRAWLAVLLLAALPASADDQRYPTVAETRAEFEGYCRTLHDGDNDYFGTRIVTRLRERLRAEPAEPLLRGLLETRLGQDLIRIGRFAEAIEVLNGVRRWAAEHRLGAELEQRALYTLALAHLQLAEAENCVERHDASSCILPITEGARHVKAENTRRAGDLYVEFLERAPEDLQARWLLLLSRMLLGEYPAGVPEAHRPPPGTFDAGVDFTRWTNVAPRLGVDAFDNCGGAIMEDFDGDGLLDLVSSSWDPCAPMKAFRNDGQGGFEDVTGAWGLDGQLGGLNLVQADYDNDGRVDIVVLRGAWLGEEGRMRNSLLKNELGGEAGRFVDVTAAAGLAYPAFPTQTAAWADYDGDGDLDLYVGNEATEGSADPLSLFGKVGNPYPSQLFRNNGDGTFTDVARAAGVSNRRFAKGVSWGDYDNDGDPDLYVSNIGANRLFRNDGGRFTDVAPELGVDQPDDGTFPTWFFDWDNDGDLDIFVAAYSAPARVVSASYLGLAPPPGSGGHAVLHRNDGGRFTDVSAEVGLLRPTLPMGANYGDLDNDGWLDVYLGTGLPDFDALMPNVMYRNDGGRRFQDVTFAGGFGHLQKGHGVAWGDLDHDGDQDIFEQMGGAFPYDAYGNTLYENPGNANAWITLELVGRRANRFGVGARIEVVTRRGEERRTIHALAGSGGSFGASSLRQEIGLGDAEAIDSITIVWPGSGTRQVFTAVDPNGFYRAVEGEPALERLERPAFRLGGDGGGGHRHAS